MFGGLKAKARDKEKELIHYLGSLDSLLVAFSGGVDSSFLLALAHQILGDRLLGATARSITYPQRELDGAVRFARERGIRHIVFESGEMGLPEFLSNGPDRCYHCKKALCAELQELAAEESLEYVAHAVNMDDLNDYRPGLRAAREMGVITPLINARLSKDEIRFLSLEMGLSTWDKAAMACLASRIPYGESITEEKLMMVETSEAFLAESGFRLFRVRHHGSVARIEIDGPEIERIVEPGLKEALVAKFREIGFAYVAVDIEGYKMGSMNRVLKDVEKERRG